jgi:hypothetical protein
LSGCVRGASAADRVAIRAADAPSSERLAAKELGVYLAQLYPNAVFDVGAASEGDRATSVIIVGTVATQGAILPDREKEALNKPGSFSVFTSEVDGKPAGCIVGADVQGLWHGVYAILERLDCGFYLSFDTLPQSPLGEFNFDAWQLRDQPLVPVRMVFNWHNFLSGCSTWNPEHWRKWITQSQKMGYNAVMVHAYGNNPMAGFSFRGKQKPVGYLSSTRVGRDWSTNHVNDVRRLWGGSVFESAVFGPNAAIEGTDRERTEAAQEMMAPVFECAEQRGVDVYFAVDVDTTSANPQELIRLLPAEARFEIDVPSMDWMGQEAGKAFLVNPDAPEGFAFYRAQVEHLLSVYPQIDCLVVWHRAGNTPWMAFDRDEMPETWRKQYEAELARTPDTENLWHAVHMFAQAKIVRAFQRAVRELGRDDVKIAFGSWKFDFLPAADRFLPEGVALIPLDWNVLKDQSIFDTAERRALVAQVGAHRPVVPIAWAHHDDGNYVGRPYMPYSNFYDRLVEMKCDSAGYGIIHWTTKPLDLYFKSLVHQVWSSSQNEPLEVACGRMASDLLGPAGAEPFADYIEQWVTSMPKIGRETSDFFIDHELEGLPELRAAHRKRMALLTSVDRAALGPDSQAWLDYFAGLERYVLDIYQTEDAFNRAKKLFAQQDLTAARAAMAECRPEQVIDRFARFSQRGGLTRGEQGLIVSMNTRWLTHYVRFRQQLGLEPVRYNFAATSHDALAQSRGIFTFHFDADRNVWETLGTEETGRPARTVPVDATVERSADVTDSAAEICRTAIELDAPFQFDVTPIMNRNSRRKQNVPGDLPAGPYRLTLLMLELPVETIEKDGVDVSIAKLQAGSAGPSPGISDRIEGAGRRQILKRTYELELDDPGSFQLNVSKATGGLLLCGVELDPIANKPSDQIPERTHKLPSTWRWHVSRTR